MKRKTPVTHKPEIQPIQVTSFEVENVRDTQYGVFLDLTINGVKIFGCKVIEGKEGRYDDFISYPSRKGQDASGADRYFSIVWAPLGAEDTKRIIAECEKQLGLSE